MGIDAKGIRVFLWKILKFSLNTCYKIVLKHPFFSIILLFCILLYIFLHTVFLVLIFTFPFIVCAAVFLRIYYSYEHPKPQNAKEDEKKNIEISSTKSESVAADPIINRNDNSSAQNQRSRRRNVKGKNKDLDAQACKEERDIESSSRNVSSVEDVQTLNECRPVSDSEASKTDLLPHNSSDEQSDKSKDGGVEEAESSEEAEEDDEEEAQEDRNRAFKWTEDDQKNLMDLGISEIERNRRLESLIAKRRARKSFKMQLENSLIDMDGILPGQFAPILIPRFNPDFINDPYGNEEFPVPGSAPSILLPARNPFDLPYDPQEEKPNLMGDSFHQEFMAAHQREISYCRHESFCKGPSFLGEPKQDRHNTKLSSLFGPDRKASEGPGYSRFRRQSYEGEHDQLIEQLLFGAPSNVENAPGIVEQEGQAPNQVINSTEFKHEEDSKTEQKMESFPDMQLSSGNGSEVQMEPYSIKDNGNESGSASSSEENEIFDANRAEVSENVEPTAGKIPEDFGNPVKNSFTCLIPKTTAVKETLYDSSPSANDNTRLEDSSFFSDKGPCHTPTYSIASDLQVEVSEVGSPRMTVDGTSWADGESLTYDGDVEKDINSGGEETWAASSYLSGVEENESKLRAVHEVSEEDIIEVGFAAVNQNSGDSVATSMHRDQVVGRDLTDTSSSSSSRPEIPQKGQASSIKLKQVAEGIGEPKFSTTSDEYSPENLEKAKNMTVKLDEGGNNSKSVEEFGVDLEKRTEHGNIADTSKSFEDKENLKLIEDSNGEQSVVEATTSGVNQSSDEPIASEVQPESVEEVSIISSSTSSPKSVLPEKVTLERVSPSDFDQEMHIDVLEPNVEDMVSDGQLAENLIRTVPQNTQTLEDSIAHQTSDTGSQNLQELSNPAAGSSEQARIVYNVTQPAVAEMEEKENFKFVETSGGESETLINYENAELTKPAKEAHSRDNDKVSDKITEDEARIGPSISAEESNNLNIPESMVKEKPTSPPGKNTTDANIIYSTNDIVVGEKKDSKKLTSVEGSGGESQSLIREEAVVEPPPKSSEENSSRFNDGASGTLTEDEVVGKLKSIETNESSGTIKDTEDYELIEHEDAVRPPEPNDNEGSTKAIKDVKGESEIVTENEAVVDPSKPAVTSENLNIPVAAVEAEELPNPYPQKSAAEVDIIHNGNESVANNEVTKVEKPADGGSQSSFIQEVIEEPSKVTGVTNSGSIQDVAIVVPSKPTEDGNNSSDIRNSEEPRNVVHPPKPGEGNDQG